MANLFFDFGNVIGFFDNRIAVRRFVCDCDLGEDACLAAIYDGPLEDDFESGRITGDEFIERACSAICYRGTRDKFRKEYEDIFRPNPAVCELTPRLAERHRLFLASNTNELHSAHFRRDFADVLRHFTALGQSFEAGARKPDRRFFDYCRNLAGCEANECLFIDDLPANVEGARAAGWRAIRYTDPANLRSELRQQGIDI
ncbi:MAG TPA: HAD family phosphatase [Gemmataceae bacterium]|nr:HAD family phosphatase [Gemmataceae bacterium]